MSEAIEDLDYNPKLEALTVHFTDGSVYTYLWVPPAVYAGFWNSPSWGAYFNHRVRSVYPYMKG